MESKVLEILSEKQKLKYVILDFIFVTDIDSSGLHSLNNLIYSLDKIGVKIYISSLRVPIVEKFDRVGFIKEMKKKNIVTKV
jgi:high affinity sulfate transporter 1